MPRYIVDFTWSTSWEIEAESIDVIRDVIAYDDSVVTDALDDAEFNVFFGGSRPSHMRTEPDAVAVSPDRLVHPSDAMEEWRRLVELEGEKQVKEFEDKSGDLFDTEE